MGLLARFLGRIIVAAGLGTRLGEEEGKGVGSERVTRVWVVGFEFGWVLDWCLMNWVFRCGLREIWAVG